MQHRYDQPDALDSYEVRVRAIVLEFMTAPQTWARERRHELVRDHVRKVGKTARIERVQYIIGLS